MVQLILQPRECFYFFFSPLFGFWENDVERGKKKRRIFLSLVFLCHVIMLWEDEKNNKRRKTMNKIESNQSWFMYKKTLECFNIQIRPFRGRWMNRKPFISCFSSLWNFFFLIGDSLWNLFIRKLKDIEIRINFFEIPCCIFCIFVRINVAPLY